MPELVTRWDLDKTYLRSDFKSLRDLARSALERPDQKRSVPGAAGVLRQLCARASHVHILSGSPRQLRRAIVTRLRMDGIEFDRLTLKPNAQNLLRLRFSALKDQLGYKLSSLLEAKLAEGPDPSSNSSVVEVLVGDDSEADAFVYSLYADICLGRVSLELLERILRAGETYSDVKGRVLGLARQLASTRLDTRFIILIHLDRQTPPSRFASYGVRLVPFHNYIQASLLLLHEGLIDEAALYEVCLEMALEHGMTTAAMAASYRDLLRRAQLPWFDFAKAPPLPEEAREELCDLLPRLLELSKSEQNHSAEEAPALDYLELARHHQGGRNRWR